MQNAAASGRMFKELFGARSVDEGPLGALLVDASRYTEMYASEYGVARNSFRQSCRLPRLSLFAEDRPKTSVGPAWLLYRTASGKFAPDRLPAEPYRL